MSTRSKEATQSFPARHAGVLIRHRQAANGVKFCQNWDISKSRDRHPGRQRSPQAIATTAGRLGCRSVAYTYNDPVIFSNTRSTPPRPVMNKGLKSVAVTAGYICDEPRREFFAHMDAANVDLKVFTDDFYHKLTGGHLQPVLDTLGTSTMRPTAGSK